MRRLPGIAAVLWIAACGCEPQFPSGASADLGGADVGIKVLPENPCADPPVGTYTFAVSASRTHPRVNVAAVEPGPLDLYLWLVSTSLGLSAVELDVGREGAELLDPAFTAEPPHLFATWEGSGEIDMAVAGCPMGWTLLGTIHLNAVAESIRVNAVPGSEHAGAVDCTPCASLHEFTSLEFRGE